MPEGLSEGEAFQVEVDICENDKSPREVFADFDSSLRRDAFELYHADEIRAPRLSETGHTFYAGQHIQMRRSSGRMSSGVVLDVHEGFESQQL